MEKTNIEALHKAISQIYSVAASLHESFPERMFTPGGAIVGCLGEIAATHFGVKLFPNPTNPGTDGVFNGRKVQIKTTAGTGVDVKKPGLGDLLLVMKIDSKDGSCRVVYDGDAERVWNALAGTKETYMREKRVSLKRLRELQAQVQRCDHIVPTPRPLTKARKAGKL